MMDGREIGEGILPSRRWDGRVSSRTKVDARALGKSIEGDSLAYAQGRRLMEPLQPAEPPDLDHVRIDVLRRSVDVYLALAYPSGPPPEGIRRRLEWPADADGSTLFTGPPFERVGTASGAAGAAIYAL